MLSPSAVAFGGYLLPAEIQPSFTALLAAASDTEHHVEDSPTLMSRLECVRGPDREVPGEVAGNHLGLPTYREALQARTLTLLPTTSPFVNSTVGQPARFLHQGELLPRADAIPSGWICEEDRRAGESKMAELASLLVTPGSGESVPPGPVTNSFAKDSRFASPKMGELVSLLVTPGSGESVSPGPVTNSFTEDSRSASDDLRVITSRLMKSHVEDLTLHHTPRGSGAGYGVGCHDILQSPLTAYLPSSSELHTGQEG